MEIWKDIQGYEGRYEVSNLGRVRTVPHYIEHNMFPGVQKFVRGRMRKLQNNGTGYKFLVLSKGDFRTVHRLVAQSFIPNTDNKPWVNHKNGIKSDNRVENLEWCTRQENEDHAFGTGLKNSTGSANQMAKLTENDVAEIKRLYVPRKNSEELAAKFGVHRVTIQRIARNKNWKHVA
jgi:hypothetical protein